MDIKERAIRSAEIMRIRAKTCSLEEMAEYLEFQFVQVQNETNPHYASRMRSENERRLRRQELNGAKTKLKEVMKKGPISLGDAVRLWPGIKVQAAHKRLQMMVKKGEARKIRRGMYALGSKYETHQKTH